MKTIDLLLKIPLKDGLIAVTFAILIFCLFEIRRLKKVIAQDARKRLSPQLMLDLNLEGDEEGMGIYLKNEGFFIAQDIRIAALQLAIDDFGFAAQFIIECADIKVLRPQEKKQLQVKVFDKYQQFLPEITEKIIPHLVGPSFKVKIFYASVEGTKFCATLSKKGKTFHSEKIELVS